MRRTASRIFASGVHAFVRACFWCESMPHIDPGTYGGNTRARSGYEYLKATEWLCAHLQDM